MHMDVAELEAFYSHPLGRMAGRFVRRRIRMLWPDIHGLDVLGLGYAAPYLKPLKESARRVISILPQACEGDMASLQAWPQGERSLTALSEEAHLPLADCAMDRVLLVHELENSEAVRPMMREIWRVLAPEGRLIVVVPCRRGLWASIERTPFGHGRPYTETQLRRLLEDCMFAPLRVERALYMPPFGFRFLIRSAGAWEQTGRRLWPTFSGVILMEATKNVFAVSARPQRVRRFAPVRNIVRRSA